MWHGVCYLAGVYQDATQSGTLARRMQWFPLGTSAAARRVWAALSSPFRMDLRSLAGLRIALAGALLVDLAVRMEDAGAHYGADGITRCTSWGSLSAPWHWDFFVCQPGAGWVYAHFALHACLALLMLLGLGTRVATLLCWLFVSSLHHRNPLRMFKDLHVAPVSR